MLASQVCDVRANARDFAAFQGQPFPIVSDSAVRVPKYRKHSQRDFAFVEWKGERIPLPGPFNSFESRTAYRTFLREHAFADQHLTPAPAARAIFLTVAEVVAGFLREAADRYGMDQRGEYANVEYALLKLSDFCGTEAAEKFGPVRLDDYRKWRVSVGDSPGYVNSQVNRIRRAFRWAVAKELLQPTRIDALQALPGLHANKRKPRSVAWEEIAAVLPHLNRCVAAMLLLQWYTAVRSESLCEARPEQFDRIADPWAWRPVHKTQFRGVDLIIPVGPRAQAAIGGFFVDGQDSPLFSPQDARANRAYGTTYTPNSYRQAVQRGQARANEATAKEGGKTMPRWYPHQIRHSRGQIVRELYGAEAAQAVLGHESLDATEIYTTRQLATAIRVAQELG